MKFKYVILFYEQNSNEYGIGEKLKIVSSIERLKIESFKKV